MVIDVLSFLRSCRWGGLMALALVFPALQVVADDQIIKKDGTVLTGQILGVDNGQVTVISHASNGSAVKLPYYLSDIQTVKMATPDAATKLSDANPATVMVTLEPLVKQYAGLPADWVVQAMVQLADSYAAQNQLDRAQAMYTQIDTLYPGSNYHFQAVAGLAGLSLKQGKIDAALAAVQPVIDQANKDIAPSATEGGLYANAFLVYGQALEAQKKNEQALEAYLTVKTMFYQNTACAAQADALAKKLRDANPGLGVE